MPPILAPCTPKLRNRHEILLQGDLHTKHQRRCPGVPYELSPSITPVAMGGGKPRQRTGFGPGAAESAAAGLPRRPWIPEKSWKRPEFLDVPPCP